MRLHEGRPAITDDAMFRSVYEHTAVAINVGDGCGRIVASNPAFRQLLGYSEEELAARPFAAITEPEDAARDMALYEQLFRGEIDSYSLEKRYIHKSGEPIWTRLTVSLVRDAEGRPSFDVALVEDIRERRRAEEALRQSEERYRSVVEMSLDGISLTDLDGHVIFANRRMARLLGYDDPNDLRARLYVDHVAPEDRALAERKLRRLYKTGSLEAVTIRFRRRDGSTFFADCSGSVIHGPDGAPAAITAVIRDITERLAYEEQLRRLALHDPLTGLANRTLFSDRLDRALRHAQRGVRAVSVLLVDLDHFKEVNDTLGHRAGDRLLMQVAERFEDALRDSDTVARLGGDEFAMVLAGANRAGAEHAANTLLLSLAEPIVLDSQPIFLGASVGIATYPQHGADAETLLRHADVAMYAAKRAGAGVAVYEEAADPHSARRLALVSGLRLALEGEGLFLHYQPKIPLQSCDDRQVEALARWRHPEHGLISPDEFIPLAEDIGLIRPLTAWVLDSALRQIHEWEETRLPVSVAVNLSSWNVQDSGLVNTVKQALRRWRVPPGRLRLEITESALINDPVRAMARLMDLHDLGVRISIDDFGTGFSSLAYLCKLPVDEIKIDRSFLVDMSSESDESAIIVRSIIDLGHNLGLEVVAEGIETDRVLTMATDMGCDWAQGYHLSRPLAAEEYPRWLAAWEALRPRIRAV